MMMLETEPNAFCMLGKHSTTKLKPQSFQYFVFKITLCGLVSGVKVSAVQTGSPRLIPRTYKEAQGGKRLQRLSSAFQKCALHTYKHTHAYAHRYT